MLRTVIGDDATQQVLERVPEFTIAVVDVRGDDNPEARAESISLNRRASSYELARGEAEETKRIYDLISARVKEIDLSQSLLSNNLRILDLAPVPNSPIKPRTMLNMAIRASC